MRTWIFLFAALTAALGAEATAVQEAEDRVVVTGSRIQRSDFTSASPGAASIPIVPAVTIFRRADEMTINLRIVGDTRDEGERNTELRQTLQRVVRTADRDSNIQIDIPQTRSFGGVRYSVLVQFTAEMIDNISISSAGREDTSLVTLRMTTPIQEDDTITSIRERLASFVAAIDVIGRTEISLQGTGELIIEGGPNRYRNDVIDAIAIEARETAQRFGEDYRITILGMENDLNWRQGGDLSVELFIPYALSVQNH